MQVRDCSTNARWRRDPLSHWQVLQRIIENGQRISPIFEAPWVRTSIFRIDWLHCSDQGVAADFLGNLFWMVLPKLGGHNLKERTTSLWLRTRAFYEANNVEDRLKNLVPTILKQPKKSPKLRCSAAQCRALVPFGLEIARATLSNAVPAEQAALAAAYHLNECYRALSSTRIFYHDILETNSRKFAMQLVALEAAHADATNIWKVKPKLHLFLELCSEGSQPAKFWNYRDEDYGGSVARFSHRRGGLLSVRAFSANLIDRFRASQPVVRMVARLHSSDEEGCFVGLGTS